MPWKINVMTFVTKFFAVGFRGHGAFVPNDTRLDDAATFATEQDRPFFAFLALPDDDPA